MAKKKTKQIEEPEEVEEYEESDETPVDEDIDNQDNEDEEDSEDATEESKTEQNVQEQEDIETQDDEEEDKKPRKKHTPKPVFIVLTYKGDSAVLVRAFRNEAKAKKFLAESDMESLRGLSIPFDTVLQFTSLEEKALRRRLAKFEISWETGENLVIPKSADAALMKKIYKLLDNYTNFDIQRVYFN